MVEVNLSDSENVVLGLKLEHEEVIDLEPEQVLRFGGLYDSGCLCHFFFFFTHYIKYKTYNNKKIWINLSNQNVEPELIK